MEYGQVDVVANVNLAAPEANDFLIFSVTGQTGHPTNHLPYDECVLRKLAIIAVFVAFVLKLSPVYLL